MSVRPVVKNKLPLIKRGATSSAGEFTNEPQLPGALWLEHSCVVRQDIHPSTTSNHHGKVSRFIPEVVDVLIRRGQVKNFTVQYRIESSKDCTLQRQ